jgi:hypothetical protein
VVSLNLYLSESRHRWSNVIMKCVFHTQGIMKPMSVVSWRSPYLFDRVSFHFTMLSNRGWSFRITLNCVQEHAVLKLCVANIASGEKKWNVMKKIKSSKKKITNRFIMNNSSLKDCHLGCLKVAKEDFDPVRAPTWCLSSTTQKIFNINSCTWCKTFI